METESRKADHIRICLEDDVDARGITSGLERYRFVHQALPEINLRDIDTGVTLWGRQLKLPLLISSMTGGTHRAMEINRNLVLGAQELGMAVGVGSQRAAIENPELATTYKMRDHAPHILLFANLGAVQLNYSYGVEQCKRAVEMIEADALVLHLNAVQEAVQPEGDTNFEGLAEKIGFVCRQVGVPVIAKEVGWGISYEAAQLLWGAGVAAIDVAGAGGTSWSQVEAHRASSEEARLVAEAFVGWGIPTADSLRNAQLPPRPEEGIVLASGGLRNGIDVAKSVALGATLAGLARPFLKAAAISAQAVVDMGRVIEGQLRVAMFGVGCADLGELRGTARLTRVE